MIQFNLLPDVKLEFIRTKRLKRLVILSSVLIAAVCLVIFIFLFTYVDVVQKAHLNSLSSQISTDQTQLGNTNNINKILTIQNQLQSLPTIDGEKPAAARLFNDLVAVTPASASIYQVSVNFPSNTISIQGTADTLTTVNQYVDTLKFTTFTLGSTSNKNAFSNVVLSSFGLSTNKTGNNPNSGASFTIDLDFNPTIFNYRDSNVLLVVPNETTTRSITEQPTDLFQKSPSSTKGGS